MMKTTTTTTTTTAATTTTTSSTTTTTATTTTTTPATTTTTTTNSFALVTLDYVVLEHLERNGEIPEVPTKARLLDRYWYMTRMI